MRPLPWAGIMGRALAFGIDGVFSVYVGTGGIRVWCRGLEWDFP